MAHNISFEFFPPKTEEGALKLAIVRDALARYRPEFFSVTFGAGGSTRDRTLETVDAIQQAGHAAAPHLSCISATRDSIRYMAQHYQALGIRRVVVLRGDIPSGAGVEVGEFRYASELVAFIREEFGAAFHLEVAAYPEVHPQARSAREDLLNFKRKIDAGANGAITQYFFSLEAYVRFVEEARRLDIQVPIVPGIMPITNFVQLARFSDACGAEIPRWLRKRLEGFGDDLASIRALGLDVVSALCAALLEQGAPGLHFYTLNQAEPTAALCDRLGIESS